MEIGEDSKYFDLIQHLSYWGHPSDLCRKALEAQMMVKANLEADVRLAATQDGILRKGNDGQGLGIKRQK